MGDENIHSPLMEDMGSSSSSLLIRLKEEMCCELKDCSRRTYDLKERRAEERPYTKFPRN